MIIKEFILNYLEEIKELPGETMEDKCRYNFVDEGHIDSFGILQLIMTVEKEFDFRFGPEHLQDEGIRTIDGMAGIIKGLKG